MCEYCDGSKDLWRESEHGKSSLIEISGSTMLIDLYTDYVALRIQYCPMCGEKLNHETQ